MAVSTTRDAWAEVEPPLDLSYQSLTHLMDLLDDGASDDDDDAIDEPTEAAKMLIEATTGHTLEKRTQHEVREKVLTCGVKLSYNELENLNGLHEVLEAFVENPEANLSWLDLSHNRLTTIPDELLRYTGLTVIYLHGNRITSTKEVRKLNALPALKKLTLHGNSALGSATLESTRSIARGDDPKLIQQQQQQQQQQAMALTEQPQEQQKAGRNASTASSPKKKGGGSSGNAPPQKSAAELRRNLEETKYYRCAIVWYLRDTQLRNLDFVPLSPRDRKSASMWAHHYRPKRERVLEARKEQRSLRAAAAAAAEERNVSAGEQK